jgi:hypothetical protein
MLGLCASSSATLGSEPAEHLFDPATRVGDLDDVLLIVLGAFAMAASTYAAPKSVALTLALATVALLIGVAGWLLVGGTESEREQHVFVAGSLLLLGGAAAYLSLSPLFAGFVAGLTWSAAGGIARERLERDMDYFQRPLIVLLLLVAGARLDASVGALILVGIYLAARTVAKLSGERLVSALVGLEPQPHKPYLLAPGVTGIALAVIPAGGEPTQTEGLLFVVVTASLISELLAVFAGRRSTV